MALLLAALLGQASDVSAVAARTLITAAGDEIADGVVVIQAGRIAAVGPRAQTPIPPGARVREAAAAMPGLVHPSAGVGLAAAGGTVETKAADALDPLDERFFGLARAGYTTLVLYPSGASVGGRGTVVKARPGPAEEMIVLRDGALRMSFAPSTAAKEELRKALKAARDRLKPEGGKAPPPEKRKDPTEAEKAWIEVYKGERRLVIQPSGAAALLHLWQVLDEFKETSLRVVYVLPPEMHRVDAALGTRKVEAIVEPSVTFLPNTADRICPAQLLHRKGCRFAFQPADPEAALLEAARTVKYGIAREAALKALTLAPAALSGVEGRVGSLEKGKDADLLLLSADPFASGARITAVLIDGRPVYEEAP